MMKMIYVTEQYIGLVKGGYYPNSDIDCGTVKMLSGDSAVLISECIPYGKHVIDVLCRGDTEA